MQRNFETSFVTQCAPVLAGLKVANLFRWVEPDASTIHAMVERWAAELKPKGVTVSIITESYKRKAIWTLEDETMMLITMAKAGETVTIKKITGKDEVRQHLAELGFVVDATVTVVNEIAGNLIIQVKESRIALDKTMANRIMIG